jgi:hypothetical protein
MKLKWFNGNYDEHAKYVKFLFCSSPINYFVGINPFKTRIYKNRNDETILSLYVDDRDSGEYSSIEKLKADDIRIFTEYDAADEALCRWGD